jgi:hypothetical protein
MFHIMKTHELAELRKLVKTLNRTVVTRFDVLTVEEMIGMVELTEAAVTAGKFKQRPSKLRVIHKYVRDIENGDWEANPQTVTLTKDGLIMDGLHRMKAAIECGRDMIFNVCSGWIDQGEFQILDTGTGRTNPQLLAMEGLKYTSLRAALARALVIAASGESDKGSQLSIQEIKRILHVLSRDVEAVLGQAEESDRKLLRKIPAAVYAALAWCRNVKTAEVDEFSSAFFNLIFTEGHPARALKKWLDGDSVGRMSRRPGPMLRVTFSALRGFLEKRKMAHLSDQSELLSWARQFNPRASKEILAILGIKQETILPAAEKEKERIP